MPALTVLALQDLPPSLRQVIESAPLPPLDGGTTDANVAEFIDQHPDLCFGDSHSPTAIALCKSGLWLLAGELDRSHVISQDMGSAEGSFWHGIMHRREGDFGNAKYWFRRVGQHAVWNEMPAGFEPAAFVDACQTALRTGEQLEPCRELQWREWQHLFAACVHA